MTALDPAQASREILWNVSSLPNVITMYAIFAVSMVVLGWGLLRRYLLWSAGVPAPDRLKNWATRFKVILSDVLGQKRVNRERQPKLFHTLILWGFLVLLFTTTMVFIDHDLGIEIYQGRFYLAVTILSDLFGLGLLIGCAYAFHVRYVQKPDRLHSTGGDAWMLILLALLGVQGFLLEALRIHATNDPWAIYSPVGYVTSLFFWGFSEPSTRVLHFLIWWFHAVTVFVFFAVLPYTKFMHIITSSANLFFKQITRPKGALPHPGSIDSILELAAETGEFAIGVSTLGDLSWKQRLDLDACTSCGRCQAVCPAYNSGKALSPKWLILDSRNHMLELFAKGETAKKTPATPAAAGEATQRAPSAATKLLQLVSSQTGPIGKLNALDRALVSKLTLPPKDSSYRRADNELVQNAARQIGVSADAKFAGEVMDEDVFWSCTTCRACMEVCPVGIEHVDFIVEARRSLTLIEAKLPAEAQASLRAIETRGNPFGPAESRADWAQGLSVPIIEAGSEVDVLYWVGCVSAYDKRKQKIARSMATILNASGLKWGILGNREHCSGDPARRLGEENLFQTSANKNIELLKSIRFKTVVANCPHCFNTLKNEYPQLGGISDAPVEVIHHTVLIKRLLDEKKLNVAALTDQSFTFHDPCYLGRYNDTYTEPRDVLVKIGGGKHSVEMEQSGKKAMCCGAGGGHYWFDMKVGQRVNAIRAEQAVKTGAQTVATGCPFCMQMLEDGLKITNHESKQVRDIAELVAEALQ